MPERTANEACAGFGVTFKPNIRASVIFTAIAAAIQLRLFSLAMLYFGYVRARLLGWLVVSAVIWAGFGGFTAWVAIPGSA